MSRFTPFTGLRYATTTTSLSELTAPPYDVVDDDERAELAARHVNNTVHVDLPVAPDGHDRYLVARELLSQWLASGVLVREAHPAFYGYRMSFVDPSGRARRTTGVLGALDLGTPGDGHILPHEHTTPKAKTDRLELLRATGTNLSPIWGLSPASGLTTAIGEPLADAETWTDSDQVEHRLWAITDPARQQTIIDAVDRHPIVVADGHHRYETSLQYRDERRSASPTGDAGLADAAMFFVVELVADELTVLPIHRLIDGLAPGTDLAAVLDPWFEAGAVVHETPTLLDEMIDGGFLVLVETSGLRAMTPRPGVFDHLTDLDTVRLDTALSGLGSHRLSYQHGIDNVIRAVADGRAQAGVLVRPASIAQISATADGGERMPPKTTFFHPKPKTGLVFRSTDDRLET